MNAVQVPQDILCKEVIEVGVLLVNSCRFSRQQFSFLSRCSLKVFLGLSRFCVRQLSELSFRLQCQWKEQKGSLDCSCHAPPCAHNDSVERSCHVTQIFRERIRENSLENAVALIDNDCRSLECLYREYLVQSSKFPCCHVQSSNLNSRDQSFYVAELWPPEFKVFYSTTR